MNFGETEDDVTLEKIEAFEKAVGKRQAIIASSSFWGEQTFPNHNLKLITQHTTPFPSCTGHPGTNPRRVEDSIAFSLAAIVAGKWDAYIDSRAAQAKTLTPNLCRLGPRNEWHMVPLVGLFLRRREATLEGHVCRTRS
jgi:hypothetical protein